ncbi:uncharacterized protein LOC101852015 [Aplysia californica]|uniref:Uncharacterized protein LOC101852015 n=1 Tax=Aplysia californica TaxID=6500 RepID=A0ABM0ZYN3_APLCA|nr:uncharacterized protein LOC101852015 [Aplysia californica]
MREYGCESLQDGGQAQDERRSMPAANNTSGPNEQNCTGLHNGHAADQNAALHARRRRRRSQHVAHSTTASCEKARQQAPAGTTRKRMASACKRKQNCHDSDSVTPVKREKAVTSQSAPCHSSTSSSQSHHSLRSRSKKLGGNPNSSSCLDVPAESLIEAVEAGQSTRVAEMLKTSSESFSSVLGVALLKAVARGELSMVQQLIHHGADVSETLGGKNCCHIAVERGYVDIVEFLLEFLSRSESGRCVANAPDKSGNTALLLCQSATNADSLTKLFLSHGIEIDAQNHEGKASLMEAVQYKNISATWQLLQAGANVELTDMRGDTAMSLASALGMDGLVEALGKDAGDQGLTPIMKAVVAKNTDLLALLLFSRQFDVNETVKIPCFETKLWQPTDTALTMFLNSKLETLLGPVTWRVENEKNLLNFKSSFSLKELELVALLVKAGAQIHSPGAQNRFLRYDSPFLMAVKLGNVKLLNVLMKNQRWVRNKLCHNHYDYASALEYAAKNSLCDIVDALAPGIEFLDELLNLKYQWRSYRFQSSLNIAMKVANEKCVHRLLKLFKSLDVDRTMTAAVETGRYHVYKMIRYAFREKFDQLVSREAGTKWLCFACYSNNYSIVESLLKAGADASGKDTFRQPLKYAMSAKMTELLLRYGASVNKLCYSTINGITSSSALEQAVILNAIDTVKVLMKYGAALDFYVLIHALESPTCHGTIRNLLLSYDIDSSFLNKEGTAYKSLLSIVAGIGDLESVQTLLKKGANVNLSGWRHSPPALHSAVERSNVEIVRCLLDHGADVNIKGYNDETALILAAKTDDGTIISLLVEKGARLNVTNSNSRSALMTAAAFQNFAAFQCLINAGVDLDVKCSNGETILSKLLCRRSFSTCGKFIVCLVRHGAKILSREMLLAVHNSIATGNFQVLSALIHCGGFSPTVFDDRFAVDSSPFCAARCYLVSDFNGVFSPFCMALVCGHEAVARDMLRAFYLTTSDLTQLPRHFKVRELLRRRGFNESLAILDKMSSSPPSLQQLCFARVSDLCGSEPGRKERVNQLELPVLLRESLMFTCSDQLVAGRCCLSRNSHEADSDNSGDTRPETRDRYILY